MRGCALRVGRKTRADQTTSIAEHKKTEAPFPCENGASRRALRPQKKSRQRPTLPHGFPCSTIGSEELNFRVRDGIGCSLFDITTGNIGLRVLACVESAAVCCPFLVGLRRPRFAIPIPGASASIRLLLTIRCCLRDMVKPHDRLVPVSSTDCSASTPGLSTT